jgi:hypothetical protein
MSIDYSALKSEIQNDPGAFGYSTFVSTGNDAGLAELLNTVQAGATYKVNTPVISAPVFINAVVRSEYDALSAADKAWLTWIVQAGDVILSGGEVRTTLSTLFGGGTTSRTNFLTLASKQISRAEYLFNQSISSDDIAKSRLA